MTIPVKLQFDECDGSITFPVRVLPRASRSEVVGLHDGALKIRIAAPPVDGAANDELVRALAKALELTQSEVAILRGHTGRSKVIRVPDRCAKQLARLVSELATE
jgi:uncharacterized protein (TIGR00251 family)